jgi:integrase
MMNYPYKEGKYGPIYQVAQGITVTPNEWGSWLVILRRGSERRKKAFGKDEDNLRQALKAAERLAARLGLSLERQGDLTFGQVAQEWLELNDPRWQPSTRERYAGIVRDYLKPLHQLPLGQIDRGLIKRLLADLYRSRAPKTVELTHAVISGVYSEANDLGYTSQNPARSLLKKLLPPKNKRAQKEPKPFTREDLHKFLEEAWKRLPERLALVMEVMAMTGLRLGEALAFHQDNLNVSTPQYHVTETTRSGRFGPPKNGTRLVDLDDTLVTKLQSHVRKLRGQALASGDQVGYFFTGITQRMVQRAMERVCRTAGLMTRRPHDLRHTYATMLLMAHISPVYVQKQLGHHSIRMTVDIYSHWIPGEGKKDLEKTLRGDTVRAPARLLRLVK